jgi:hypothetical protein
MALLVFDPEYRISVSVFLKIHKRSLPANKTWVPHPFRVLRGMGGRPRISTGILTAVSILRNSG